MAMEDGWVLAGHVRRQGVKGSAEHGTPTGIDWDAALAAYNAVRPVHCRRVLTHSTRLGQPVAPRRRQADMAQ